MKLFQSFCDSVTLKKIDFLKNIKLFQGIKKRDLLYILENLQERVYLKGETIFEQGDIGRALFIVFSGKISLSRFNKETGKNETLSEVNPGEFFGEMALLEEMPRTATACALEDTTVFMLFKTKLESILFSKPNIGINISIQIAKILSARLRSLMEKNTSP